MSFSLILVCVDFFISSTNMKSNGTGVENFLHLFITMNKSYMENWISYDKLTLYYYDLIERFLEHLNSLESTENNWLMNKLLSPKNWCYENYSAQLGNKKYGGGFNIRGTNFDALRHAYFNLTTVSLKNDYTKMYFEYLLKGIELVDEHTDLELPNALEGCKMDSIELD